MPLLEPKYLNFYPKRFKKAVSFFQASTTTLWFGCFQMFNLSTKFTVFKRDYFVFFIPITHLHMKLYIWEQRKSRRWQNEKFVLKFRKLSIKLIHNLWMEFLHLKKMRSWSEKTIKLNLKFLHGIKSHLGRKLSNVFGAKLWNNLPCNIKSSQNLEIVKSMIDKYICSGPLVFESQRCRVWLAV